MTSTGELEIKFISLLLQCAGCLLERLDFLDIGKDKSGLLSI
jgi:hypothetical protein